MVERKDRTLFDARQRVCKSVAEVQGKREPCPSRNLGLLLIGRDTANAAREQLPLQRIGQRRLSVSNPDERFRQVYRTQPKRACVAIQLVRRPCRMRLVEVDGEDDRGVHYHRLPTSLDQT